MNDNSIEIAADLSIEDLVKYKIAHDSDVRYLLLQLFEKIQDLKVIEDINRCMPVKKDSLADYAYHCLLKKTQREVCGLSDIVIQLIKQCHNNLD